jgi:hypothetical protein
MKLNRKALRKMILKEIKLMTETQKSVGLPHKYSNMELVKHTMNFIQEMSIKHGKVIPYGSPDYKRGELLLTIVHNATQQAVQHSTHRQGSYEAFVSGDVDAYQASLGHETSPEETEFMRQEQGDLKMVRNALANLLGMDWKYSGGRGREDLAQRMRELDPTGAKQKFGRFRPSDDPELRKNMPEYQPGGRFYDPDDPIHN